MCVSTIVGHVHAKSRYAGSLYAGYITDKILVYVAEYYSILKVFCNLCLEHLVYLQVIPWTGTVLLFSW